MSEVEALSVVSATRAQKPSIEEDVRVRDASRDSGFRDRLQAERLVEYLLSHDHNVFGEKQCCPLSSRLSCQRMLGHLCSVPIPLCSFRRSGEIQRLQRQQESGPARLIGNESCLMQPLPDERTTPEARWPALSSNADGEFRTQRLTSCSGDLETLQYLVFTPLAPANTACTDRGRNGVASWRDIPRPS